MKKVLFFLIIIITIFIKIKTPVMAEIGENKTIWDYNRDDFINHALMGNDDFFDTKKQEIIDRELEKVLNVKLIPITLEECLQIAVMNNYVIKTRTALERESVWNKRNAYSNLLPEFSYDFSLQFLSGTYLVGGIVPNRVNEKAIQSYITADWNIFEKGRVFFDISAKRNLYKSAKLLKDFSKEEIIYYTAKSYYKLMQDKAELDIYTSNVIDRKAQYELTQARYKVGVGTKFDVYRSEAELEKSRQQYTRAFNTVRSSQAKLANYMGVDVLTPLYPKDVIINKKQLIEEENETLITWAKKSRKDIQAEFKRIEAMKAERTAYYTEFIPNIQMNYVKAENGTVRVGVYPSNTFSINVNATLGDHLGLGTMTKVKAHTSKIKAAEYSLEQKIRDIEENIITSQQNARSAEERIKSSKKEVEASIESLNSSIILMNAGLSTFIDVIQAQALKVDAQVRLAENITDYNISEVEILFNSGIISIDNVLNGIYKSTP